MSLASLVQAIQDTDFFTSVRESGLAYPVIMSTHLTCIGIFGGMILLTDLRLLGLTLTRTPASAVIAGLRPWKWLGFAIMVTCGILLGGAKLALYYDNPYFQLKMLGLLLVGVHAMAFRKSVYANPTGLDEAEKKSGKLPQAARTAAIVSLCLWIGILSCGRWIAYFERPEEHIKPASSVTAVAP